MAVDTSIVGKPTAATKVRVERGPVTFFAAAVLDDNPVFRDPTAGRAAGLRLDARPARRSRSRCSTWAAGRRSSPPTRRRARTRCTGSWASCYGKGALILHGEQEFTYHRPIVVGDVLVR